MIESDERAGKAPRLRLNRAEKQILTVFKIDPDIALGLTVKIRKFLPIITGIDRMVNRNQKRTYAVLTGNIKSVLFKPECECPIVCNVDVKFSRHQGFVSVHFGCKRDHWRLLRVIG